MAFRFDLTGEFALNEGAEWNHVITWKDKFNNPIDITGYGALMIVAPRIGKSPIFTGDESNYITVGTTDGEFIFDFPETEFQDLNYDWLEYQFFVYPDTANPQSDRKLLLYGKVEYRRKLKE